MNFILILILFLFGSPFNDTDKPYHGLYHYDWKSFYTLPGVNEIIDLHNPDYELLDAALYHATNEVREKYQKPLLKYSEVLHRAAALHSNSMIEEDFYDHYNSKDKKLYYPVNRIKASGGNFSAFAENIAEYQIIKTGSYYCPTPLKNGSYTYLNCKNNQTYPTYTYLEYARRAVDGWLNSPSHRINLLSVDVQYVGCAARISKDPFKHKQAPFARLTQKLGGGKVEVFTVADLNK